MTEINVTFGPIDKYKKSYALLVDGEEWKQLSLSIFGKKPSFSNVSDEQSLHERCLLLEYKGAKTFLLRKLSLKNYHSCELRGALLEKKVSTGTASALLEEFQQLGYLNDEAWVMSQIRALVSQKFGSKAISHKLRLKGVPEEEILEGLRTFKENNGLSEKESIKRLLASRYANRDLKDRKERNKVIAGLARKGFSLDDIFSLL